jgi:putative ABC transport system substrate-binding protein
VVAGTPATRAAQIATSTIPIVMGNVGDPEGSGFVKSLARPGGNITGLAQMAGEGLPSKRLEMLLEMVPKLSRVAVLANPSNTDHTNLAPLQASAQKRGVTILRADARTPQEIDQAFVWMRQQKAGALILVNDGLLQTQKKQIYDWITKQRLPSIAMNREQAEEGMLMSYGVNAPEQYRRAATYVDKIFKGAKPAELPVERPTTLELVINGKTAKALGLTIPYALRIRATEVIEK